ncbi:MAG TPA: agmatine deiminase family protein [Cyclobacteriaceae bacterium]|nr:agmatine deiminase family protein [Cyclobacteriaceae bacterium]
MITNPDTNFVYLADSLRYDHKLFYRELDKIISEFYPVEVIDDTADIWARDFMPIQVSNEIFVQFDYHPDYLVKFPHLRTDQKKISYTISSKLQTFPLNIDGGNVIKGRNWVIMTDKVFKENSKYPVKQIIQWLEKLFDVEKIIWLPWNKKEDIFGHSDGIVNFYNNETVLINDYTREPEIRSVYLKILKDSKLQWIEIAYNPYDNKRMMHACGIYVNFLQVGKLIIIPVFDMKEDELVMKQFGDLYKGYELRAINSRKIAEKGGVLHCISWNIFQP